MSRFWRALKARVNRWSAENVVAQDNDLWRPGLCECEHERCAHVGGKGQCSVAFPPDKEWPGSRCACQVYIRDNGDFGSGTIPTPSPAELERMFPK